MNFQIATVMPSDCLHMIHGQSYHMSLAHLMKRNIPSYQSNQGSYGDFFKCQADLGSYVMMDNGVVETGDPLPMDHLLDLASEYHISEIIVPDVIGDREANHDLALRSLEHYSSQGIKGFSVKTPPNLMVVPHGKTLIDWGDSLALIMDALEVEFPDLISRNQATIGISRFERIHTPDRTTLIRIAYENTYLPIHVLGCTEDPIVTSWWRSRFPPVGNFVGGIAGIRGIDSGLPVFYSYDGVHLSTSSPRIPRKTKSIDFAGGTPPGVRSLLEANLEIWLERATTRPIVSGWCNIHQIHRECLYSQRQPVPHLCEGHAEYAARATNDAL